MIGSICRYKKIEKKILFQRPELVHNLEEKVCEYYFKRSPGKKKLLHFKSSKKMALQI